MSYLNELRFDLTHDQLRNLSDEIMKRTKEVKKKNIKKNKNFPLNFPFVFIYKKKKIGFRSSKCY